MTTHSRQHVILYDGACPLCRRFIQTVLKRDVAKRFAVLPLQSSAGESLLAQHGVAGGLSAQDTVVLLRYRGENGCQILVRSDAVLFCVVRLGGWYRLAAVLYLLPRVLRDVGYRAVSRYRYRFFGGKGCGVCDNGQASQETPY